MTINRLPKVGAYRLVPWLLVMALAGAATACQPDRGEAGGQNALVDELEEENTKLRSEFAELEQRIATGLQSENDALREEVARLQQELASASAVPEAGVQPLPVGTLDGLEDALRAYLPEREAPGQPGVTAWRASGVSLPDDLSDPGQGTSSHGLLALRLLAAVVDVDSFGGTDSEPLSFPWEVTTRVLQTAEDQAVVVVQLWGGMGDDSVAGTDYMFELRLGGSGWVVDEAAERDQCVRSGGRPGDPDLPARCV